VSPKTHFLLTDRRLETPEKKMHSHQNQSPNYSDENNNSNNLIDIAFDLIISFFKSRLVVSQHHYLCSCEIVVNASIIAASHE